MAEASLTLVSEQSLADDRFVSGSGTPNGIITAAPGSIYTDTAKTWDVLAWIKQSGTGNTGWEVLRAEAITRSIIALSSTPVAGGDIQYTRTESGITLTLRGVKPTADGTLSLFTDGAIASIAPPDGAVAEFRIGVGNTVSDRRAKLDQYGLLTIYGVLASDALYGSTHYNMTRPWQAPLGSVV